MLETSQNVLRIVALVASTALFAGLWANDRPAPMLAQHGTLHRPEMTGRILDSQPVRLVTITAEPELPTRETENETLRLTIGGLTKTVSLETDSLTISSTELTRHIAQLPLGLAAGDYRIVDSQGGVGWLHVRSNDEITSADGGPDLLTTTLDAVDVRFVRVLKMTSQPLPISK